MALRIVLMGTGEFAHPSFQKLIDSPHEIVGLVTQPDRTGRGHHQHVNPLKELALGAGIEVFQPEKVNQPAALDQLQAWNADLFVVAAYGQILSRKLLAIPRLGAINIHGSLLPRFRGAAPVQFAVLSGDAESGVTIFRIEPQLDSGPMLGMLRTEIGKKETSGQLHDRLAVLAAPLILDVVDQLDAGTAQEVLQDVSQVTLAPKILKQDGIINWSRSSREIDCHVRGMQPWPMASTLFTRPGKPDVRLIVLETEPVSAAEELHLQSLNVGGLKLVDGRLFVRTGDTALEMTLVQPAGKRPMSGADFARGYPLYEARLTAPAVE